MRTLAGWCVAHRRLVVTGWLVALIGLTAISHSLGSSYKDSFSLPGTQSFEALNLLQTAAPKASGDREQIVVAVEQGKVTDPAVLSQVEPMLTKVAVIALLSHLLNIASFSSELALLIGLGVGVDYALFIVTRVRQGLQRGTPIEQAIVDAIDTSGRAVMFAGIIVCIALLGMFALGVSFIYGVAVAASIAVLFTVVAAMPLLPALLGFFGTRVLGRKARRRLAAGELTSSDESPSWGRWARALRERPALIATAAAVLMVMIAVPFFSMRLGSADPGSGPAGTTTRKALDHPAQGFGPGYHA